MIGNKSYKLQLYIQVIIIIAKGSKSIRPDYWMFAQNTRYEPTKYTRCIQGHTYGPSKGFPKTIVQLRVGFSITNYLSLR